MAFTENSNGNGTGMYMPVAPMGNYYGGGNGFGNGFGGDGAWWILVLFLFAFGGGRWGNGGYGNGNGSGGFGGGDTLAIGSIGNGYRDAIQSGFDQQAVMNSLNGISGAVTNGFSNNSTAMCNGFAGINTNLCNGFSGVNATVNQGFANAEIADNARQVANMQQQFNSQTAMTANMNALQSQLAQCCCDNRLATANLNSTIMSENCADRAAVNEGMTNLLMNQTANTQRLVDVTTNGIQAIQDKLCQLELDGIKQNYENRISGLQNALDEARLANQTLSANASRTAQTASIISNNDAQTAALENYLNPPARPAYIVQNPNVPTNTCYNGCGCGA